MKAGFKQIHKPTPAKIVKLGSALIATGSVITGSAISSSNQYLGYTGLGFVAAGTLITNLIGD